MSIGPVTRSLFAAWREDRIDPSFTASDTFREIVDVLVKVVQSNLQVVTWNVW